ncbi:helix-turn-helix domain-containing protein [Sporolactobacillus kofuensis]|uniref:Helix-turn-helix domain-containing protein n=1 Tax=Sporolactobacillus kofuensis TaxID=269672 RepID=A0ABW1WAL8_9BACL|nr:helix-turn-helix domain-containing protein [Sporolactobacillus kofuensis]MCO7177049.1 helix-turn-helix domain-containing protein [Sporolactobacillus kofuensis]
MHDSERMTAQEAADYIGCHKETIYRMARRGEIPHWRIGRNVRFSKSSLDEWKEHQELQSVI